MTQPVLTKPALDCLEQSLVLGDVVVSASNSNLLQGVITRFGSKDNVEINNCGYIYNSQVLKITDQFIKAKGQKSYEEFVGKFKINTEAVKAAKTQVTFVIARIATGDSGQKDKFGRAIPNYVYHIFEVHGNTVDERRKYWTDNKCLDIIQGYMSNTSSHYYTTHSLYIPRIGWDKVEKPPKFGYSCGPDSGISRRAMLSLNPMFERHINKQIDSPVLISYLDGLKD